MKGIPAIHPAITENTENVLVKRVPRRLIIGKSISQHASYSAMFCPNISKEQHEKHCNPSSHYGKYGESTREMCTLYIISRYVKAMINKPSAVELWPFVEGSPLSLPHFLPRGSCGYVRIFRKFVTQKLLLYSTVVLCIGIMKVW